VVEFGGHNPFTIVFLKKSLPTLCNAFIVDFFPQNWRVFSTVLFCRTLSRQAGTHRLGSRRGAAQVSGCRRPTRKNDVMGFEAIAFLGNETTEFTVAHFASPPPKTIPRSVSQTAQPQGFSPSREEHCRPQALSNRQDACVTASMVEGLILRFLLSIGEAEGRVIANQINLPFLLVEQTDARVDQVGTASLAQRGHRDQQPCPCLGAHRVGAPVDVVDDSPMHLSRASASRASRADYRLVNCPSRNCQPRDLLLQIKSFCQYKRVADRNEERVRFIRRR